MKNLLIILTVFLGTEVFASAGGGSSIGPANPASVNCIKLGGTSELMNSPAGQYGNCVVEEWRLFGEMNQRGLVKNHTYPPGGMPNPAAVNCIESGGELRSVQTPGGTSGFCVIEEWQLFGIIDVTRE